MGQWLEINQWIFMGRKPRFYSLGISIPLSKFASSYISILYCEAIISGSRIICGPRQYYDLYSCQEQFHKKFSRGREGGGGGSGTLGLQNLWGIHADAITFVHWCH